ncbi:hypothetical protein AB0469_29340 [Streptomyces sp. NPDC093801]|uniref:hypothetical protein n=1 Tax=Streptomyces sp. NPDC093801 TaxID=3155203 RepID=UPI00344FB214
MRRDQPPRPVAVGDVVAVYSEAVDAWTASQVIGHAFGAAFNMLDSRSCFIETVEREELFDALDHVADEAQTATGRDLTAARAALVEAVNSVRDR